MRRDSFFFYFCVFNQTILLTCFFSLYLSGSFNGQHKHVSFISRFLISPLFIIPIFLYRLFFVLGVQVEFFHCLSFSRIVYRPTHLNNRRKNIPNVKQMDTFCFHGFLLCFYFHSYKISKMFGI